MTDNSTLNEAERKVRDHLKGKLGAWATITKVKEHSGRIAFDIVSPNDFDWTEDRLAQAGSETAQLSKCAIDVNLSTFWSPE